MGSLSGQFNWEDAKAVARHTLHVMIAAGASSLLAYLATSDSKTILFTLAVPAVSGLLKAVIQWASDTTAQ